MSESTTPYHDPLSLRKNGCLWVLVIVGSIAGVIILPWGIQIFFHKGHKELQPGTILKDIKYALLSYELDYQHFPLPAPERHGPDVSLRSRGPMLTALIGEDAALNPSGIKFIDFPAAKNRKDGLWKDGAEKVLSDLWGEPYYIVLDTNKDGLIANPEFGADQSDSAYAKRCRANPPPATLPLKVLIFSSGPDRDPKTWKDNVCSWRTR